MGRGNGRGGDAPGISICFWFNAQRHQLLHGLSTACALSRRAGCDVTIASPSHAHVEYARQLTGKLGGENLRFLAPQSHVLDAARRAFGGSVPPKILSLAMLATRLNRFDAIAVPERTSLMLRRMGVRRPKFIHLDHGAGDRAVGFDRRIAQFDFVLMAGEKHRERLARAGLIRPGCHAVIGYPKFEAADAARDRGWHPFPGDRRPVVLYNPHFTQLGSWEKLGEAVLAAFADQDEYNLVLAPHVRLLDGKGARRRFDEIVSRYSGHPRIYVDAGSDRSIDMTHTTLADIYVGDVSSQVYEFLRKPRPCLFLNANDVDWRGDENYRHWNFGAVVRDAGQIMDEVRRAQADHHLHVEAQRAGFAETFSAGDACDSERAADAIGSYLRAELATDREPVRTGSGYFPALAGLSAGSRLRRAALAAPALLAGWMLHDLTQPTPIVAMPDSFVDEAIASHRILLLRDSMRSQPETIDFDPGEIAAATGISIPHLPPDWHVLDVQVFPSDTGPSIQLAIETGERQRFTMAAMRRVDTPADGKPLLDRREGEQVAFWEQQGFAYALVGRDSAANLLNLASRIAEGKGEG